MTARLRPLRHALPLVALAFAAAAWLLPPYFQDQAGLSLFVEPLAVSAALVGWLLTTKRPENPIGWVFSAWSVGVGFNCFVGQYVNYARVHPGSLPGSSWVAWAGTVLWHPGFGMFVVILLLFPTGTALSARWRRFTWFAVCWYVLLGASVATYPQLVVDEWYPYVRPPFHGPAPAVGNVVYVVTLTGNLGLIFIALASQVHRYRRSPEAQRYQIKWFVWPTVGALLVVLASFSVFGDGTLFPFVLPVIPCMAGFAILRYRLYDIDRVVSRTVAWLLLTGVVAGVYVGVVTALTVLLPGSSTIAVAAATLAAAATFEPARRRLQAAVDHRFNRSRYDASVLVERFAVTLRDSVELTVVERQLLDAACSSLQPTTASLWFSRSSPVSPSPG